MESALERLPFGARICVIRLRSLGDCVLTTPALRLLKGSRPDVRLSIVVEPRFAAVFSHNPDIDSVLEPGIAAIYKTKPDFVLNLHGGTSSILLTLASRAKLRAGFAHFRAQVAYNIQIPTAQEILGVDRKVHTAEHLASAMFYLGVPQDSIPRARLYPRPAGRPRPYAILHPFASKPEKSWPSERFLGIARAIEAMGIQPLILCGPGEDPTPFPGVQTLRDLPLDQAIDIIGSAAMFVGNDSGPAHIAAACAIPSVVLFGGSDPVIWAPWKAPETTQIVRSHVSDIQVEDVLAALDTIRVRS